MERCSNFFLSGKVPSQRSVLGVLDILEVLAETSDGLALTEIAHRAKLAKSATHRLLSTLAEKGLVTQDEATQHYRLTMRLTATTLAMMWR